MSKIAFTSNEFGVIDYIKIKGQTPQTEIMDKKQNQNVKGDGYVM